MLQLVDKMLPFLSTAGNILSVIGLGSKVIGSYYDAQAQKLQARSTANQYEFKKNVAGLNIDMLENQAMEIHTVSEFQKMNLGLRAAQRRATAKTSFAARGILSTTGTPVELLKQNKLMYNIDLLTLDSNTMGKLRENEIAKINAKLGQTGAQLQSTNLRNYSNVINPLMAAGSTLLTGPGNIFNTFNRIY